MRRRLGIAIALAIGGCTLLVGLPHARAVPLLALRPGGTPFEGPTDPEVSALWWNPAAIAQLRGLHMLATGQLQLQRGSIARDPICSSTGLPCSGADGSFPETPIADTVWGGSGGVTWDFRQENLAIGAGVFFPWEQHRRFGGADTAAPGSGELPTAYHLRYEDFRTLYFTVGLGVKLSQKIAIGVSVSIANSSATVSFDRDTALDGGSDRVKSAGGYEQGASASRITAVADGGTFWKIVPSPTGLGISVGGTYEPTGWLSLGASWSRMFPFYGNESGRYTSSRDVGTQVVPAASMGNPCPSTDGGRTCRGGATLTYDIPDVWHAGARMRLSPTVELSTWGRVVVYGPYHRSLASDEALVIELTGEPVDRGVAPGRIVLGRSLTPTFAGELGVRWWAVPQGKAPRFVSLRLGASLIAETSAVPGDHLNAETLDGPKLDGMVGAELRLRWLRVMAGYEFTGLILTSLNSPSPGAFDPGKATSCADQRYALEACGDALAGRALPTNAGHYALYNHRISVALGIDL